MNGLALLSNVATIISESDPESSSSSVTKDSSEIEDKCNCKRCKGCTYKKQFQRTVCARCRDKRCMCSVCGQKREKITKKHQHYVIACNCVQKKIKILDQLKLYSNK